MTYTRGIQTLANHIGTEPEYVARALRTASRAHAVIRANQFQHMTDEQFRRLMGSDRHVVAVVANLALRFAGRIEDALLLMDIYHASHGAKPPRQVIRKGVGTLPEHHDHPHIQQAIRILDAAGLPPIVTDDTRELRPGFQVLPACDALPGWIFIAPDPDCGDRTGFSQADRSATSPSCAGPDGASSPNPCPPDCGPSSTPTTATTPSPPSDRT